MAKRRLRSCGRPHVTWRKQKRPREALRDGRARFEVFARFERRRAGRASSDGGRGAQFANAWARAQFANAWPGPIVRMLGPGPVLRTGRFVPLGSLASNLGRCVRLCSASTNGGAETSAERFSALSRQGAEIFGDSNSMCTKPACVTNVQWTMEGALDKGLSTCRSLLLSPSCCRSRGCSRG